MYLYYAPEFLFEMMNFQFLIFIWHALSCYAVRQQLTIHTDWDCMGDALGLQSKQPDVVKEAPRIISTTKSYSVIGRWVAYDNVNFRGRLIPAGVNESVMCLNTFLTRAQSIRHLGPLDTTTPSLSFYEDTFWSGEEITFTGSGSADIPFAPKSLFSTGLTCWTFYSDPDFGGAASYYTPPSSSWYHELVDLNSTLSSVRSILRGCDHSNH